MKYDFDKIVDRSTNHAVKWSEVEKGALPMWVADMDFETAPEILQAMREKLDQKIFGYVSRPDSYYESAADWTKRRYGYSLDPKKLVHSPGVVPSISLILRLFSKPEDKILIQPPVYHPFANSIHKNNRLVVASPLHETANGYCIDLDDFEKKAADPNVKWFILSNPHNPVGKVWTREELQHISDICLRHNVRVIADEIWRDLVFKGSHHVPFASLSKETEDITITLFAASKTFNLAGLQASFVSFPRLEDQKIFEVELDVIDIPRNNPFSLVATETAFRNGEPWLKALLEYLEGNLDFIDGYIRENLPEIKMHRPQGTYLAWLDFRSLRLDNETLSALLKEKGRVVLNDGYIFGQEGSGFMRMNFACPRALLKEGLDRIHNAISAIE